MKIAVVAVGTRGDVQPHLALASRLRHRGHHVCVAAPLDFERHAATLALPFHPLGASIRDVLASEDGAALLASGRRPFRLLSLLRKVAVPIVERIIADVDAACADCDVVCYSPLGLPAHFAAKARGIRSIPTCMQPLGRTRGFPSPLFPLNGRTPAFLNQPTHVLVEQVFWQLFRPFLRRGFDVPLPFGNHFAGLYAAQAPMLFAFSPLVVPRPSDWGPWMHATGYWTLPHDRRWVPPAGLVDFLEDGPPPVCVGFGSMHTRRVGELLQMAVPAIRRLGRRAIVLTGWSDDLLDRSAFGTDVFAAEAVPHDWLFPRVAAVIHHGGAGTTAAACRAGVPSVVVPFFFDQGFWGNALYRHALGPAPLPNRGELKPLFERALEDALTSLSLRRNLETLSARLGAEDGAGLAVSVIEQVAGIHKQAR